MAGQPTPPLSLLQPYSATRTLIGHILARSMRWLTGKVRRAAHTAVASFWLYFIGVPYLPNRSTIEPWYLIKITLLTVWAYVFNSSFVIHRPGQLPRFIARSSNTDLRTFTLTHDDIHHIYLTTGTNLRVYQVRRWKPTRDVCNYLHYVGHDYRQIIVHHDITHRRLVGPHLVQGLGLVGHGICVALVEEFGRYPGKPFVLTGKVFSWNDQQFHNIKFPASFAAVPGVVETTEIGDMRITVEWQLLEDGMCRGLRASAISLDDYVDFKGLATPPSDALSDIDSIVLPPDLV